VQAGCGARPAPRLHERDLLERGGPAARHHLVQRQQRGQHGLHVALAKVLPRRLLQRLVPHLVPQDGHANQLCADLRARRPRWKGERRRAGGRAAVMRPVTGLLKCMQCAGVHKQNCGHQEQICQGLPLVPRPWQACQTRARAASAPAQPHRRMPAHLGSSHVTREQAPALPVQPARTCNTARGCVNPPARLEGAPGPAHQLRLLDQRGGVRAHVVHDRHRCRAPEGRLALARHEERVHERLARPRAGRLSARAPGSARTGGWHSGARPQ